MIGGFRHRLWCVSTSSPSACFRHHRLVSSPSRMAYYVATNGHLHLLHQLPRLSPTDYFAAMATQLYRWAPSSSLLADLTAADWFLHLHSCATSSLLIGITIFTTTNIFATSAGQYYLCIGRLVSMPTASATINGQLWLRAQGLTSSNTSIIPSIWTCSGYMQYGFMIMGLFSMFKDWTIYYSP